MGGVGVEVVIAIVTVLVIVMIIRFIFGPLSVTLSLLTYLCHVLSAIILAVRRLFRMSLPVSPLPSVSLLLFSNPSPPLYFCHSRAPPSVTLIYIIYI